MIGFSREVDYSIRIVHCLSNTPDIRMYASEISAKTGVSLRFALKILGRLAKSGIVDSIKGVSGGYMLARSREKISLLNVVNAIMGEVHISPCCGPDYDCNHPDHEDCVFHELFCEMSDYIVKRLGEVDFDMTARR